MTLILKNIELPDAADFEDVIGAVRHSAPGRDGLPYIAWKAEKEVSAYILSGVSDHLAEQEVPEPGTFLHNFLDDFNQEYVVFAPKGIEEADRHAPTRAPQNLRTIFLINSDNKLIAGATKRRLIGPCMRITPANQRGFSPGRQFCLNIVVLDAFMRIFNQLSDFAPVAEKKCPMDRYWPRKNSPMDVLGRGKTVQWTVLGREKTVQWTVLGRGKTVQWTVFGQSSKQNRPGGWHQRCCGLSCVGSVRHL